MLASEERAGAGAVAPERRSRLRQLPQVLAASALVSVLPAMIAATVVPSRRPAAVVCSILLAVVLSTLAARAGAAIWSRRRDGRDVLFADLMLWSWLARMLVEWRLTALARRMHEPGGRCAGVPIAALARWSRLLEARDSHTYGHSRRVARHAHTIARAMHLPADDVQRIRQAALLHDVGKLRTPRAILDKPGRLTDAEFAVIKRHPGDGADMLVRVAATDVVAMVRHHHERMDGKGYPDGLRGEAIPLGARIIAVADTFDALTSTRAYRPSSTQKQALAILSAEAGTQLDADAVAVFLRHYRADRPAAITATVASALQRGVGWLAGGPGVVAGGVSSLAAAAPVVGTAALIALAGGSSPATDEAAAPIRRTTPTAAQRVADHRVSAPRTSAGHRSSGAARTTRTGSHAPSAAPAERRQDSRAPHRRKPRPDAHVTPPPSAPGSAPGPGTTPATRPTPTTEVRTPEVRTPEVRTPEVTTPSASTPAVATPSVTVPATTTPAVTTPTVAVAPPQVTTPQATTPSVETPSVPDLH